jgi:purine nucleosidase
MKTNALLCCLLVLGMALPLSLQAAQPVPIIFDTDIDSDCDDVGALAMLHALADRGEARILAVMMSDPNGESPRCADAINTFYGRPDIPIGVRKPGGGKAPSRYARQIADEFPHKLRYETAPEAVPLYRRVLAAQPDNSVVIVTVGTKENLAELLATGPDEHSPLSGAELVRRKVRLWSCMGGYYPGGRKEAEHNFKFGGRATAQAVNGWPTPIVFSGWELGVKVITGAGREAIPEPNPVRRAYDLYCKPGQGRYSWDQTSVLYAVRGAGDYWSVHRGGHNHVFDDGRNEWRASPDRDHAYLVEKMNPAEVARIIDELMAHQPRR